MTGENTAEEATLEFDVEGQAFSLRFPTMQDADAFKRGVVTGALAATLVVGGSIGAVTVATQHASVPVAVSTTTMRIGMSAADADHPESVSLAVGDGRHADADHPESVSLGRQGMAAADSDHPESVSLSVGSGRHPDADHPASVDVGKTGMSAPDADHPESVPLSGSWAQKPDATHPDRLPIQTNPTTPTTPTAPNSTRATRSNVLDGGP